MSQTYEPVIGLEIHTQLLTKTKLFCGCSTQYGNPEINSPSEAVKFLQLFRTTLQYLEICDGNMEEGSLRCDANLSVRKLADYFEKTANASKSPKQTSNWIMREVLQYLKEKNIEINQFPLPPEILADIIILVKEKKISLKIAKEEIFPEILKIYASDKIPVSGKVDVSAVVKERGLGQIFEEGKIKEIILEIIEKNPEPLKQYLEEKVEVLGFFVGQVMKETKGSANPQLINKLLKEILDGHKN